MEQAMIIARAESVRGEVVLRRRPTATGPVEELIINGAFAMDSAETSSERQLGRLASGADRVLLGGLGLGYTASELLESSVRRLDIVELEPELIEWARRGLTQVLRRVASDPRVRLHAGDIADVLDDRIGAGLLKEDRTCAEHVEVLGRPSISPGPAIPTGPWDAILLDVDNGPDFLIHPQNEAIYGAPRLAATYRSLAPRGLLAIWCQGEVPSLEFALRQLAGGVGVSRLDVTRGGRQIEYVIYTLTRADSSGGGR